MVTTDLGACEWFVWDLRRSNLIDRGQLDQVVGEFLEKSPRAEPPALAEYLVSKEILTQFQADRLLQGKTQGFVLGPFTLRDALGSGSMGTVYKALSKNDNKAYAVKVLPRRSMWNVRIARRKVRAFEQCQHPSVVPFVDVGTSGSMHYLAWPLVEGETLDKLVQREVKLSPGLAAAFALQTAQGLAVCHEQGLFHGLLKPSNLMITADQQVRILDFGIGALLAETEGESLVDTMSTANSVASGLDCASPESIMEPTNLTPLGDQYSLGCVLYYCLTGRYPFPDGTAADKMMAHQLKQPVPIRELVTETPEALVAIVERLMQKSPEARYSGTAEVVEALQPLASLRSLLQRPPAPASAPPLRNGHAEKSRTSPLPQPEAPRPTSRPSTEPHPRPRQEPVALPSRQSLRASGALTGAALAQPKVVAPSTDRATPRSPAYPKKPVADADVPSQQAPAEPTKVPERSTARSAPDYQADTPWEEKIGPVGIAISAILLCGLAWLLTWKLF